MPLMELTQQIVLHAEFAYCRYHWQFTEAQVARVWDDAVS